VYPVLIESDFHLRRRWRQVDAMSSSEGSR
jgi:hypothetical protein